MPLIRRGWSQYQKNTGQDCILSGRDAGARTGDWMVAAFTVFYNSPPGSISAAGWTSITPLTPIGTRYFQVFAKQREAGDPDNYTFSSSDGQARGVLIALGGAAHSNSWTVGTVGTRPNGWGTTTTSVAPSITTSTSNNLILTIASEATSADDTVAPTVTSGDATDYLWSDDTGALESIFIAQTTQDTPAATGDVTITYQNSHVSNSCAVQICIPPNNPPAPATYNTVESALYTTQFETTTHDIVVPPDIDEGDRLVLIARGGNTSTITTPSGWTLVSSRSDTGVTYVFSKVATASEPVFYKLTTNTAIRLSATIFRVRGGHEIAASFASTNVNNPPELVVPWEDSDTIWIAALTNGRSDSSVTGAPSGLPDLRTIAPPSFSGNAVTRVSTAHARSAVTSLNPNAFSTSGTISAPHSVTIGVRVEGSVEPPEPKTVELFDGEDAIEGAVSYYVNSQEVTPTHVGAIAPGYTSISDMLSHEPFYVAHRGGSADWPEMSMQAYTNSVAWGAGALEISLSRTSDGVWFGLHDQTLDRVSGTSGANPSSMTWAQVQNYLIFNAQPFMRWEDILSTYGQTHVLFVDPKYQTAAARRTELYAMLKQVPNWQTRVVFKYFFDATWWSAEAKAQGFTTWGYYYEEDVPLAATTHQNWDILGLNYDASPEAWSTLTAIGKPVIGHVCPDLDAANLALSKGAAGIMSAGVSSILPGPIVRT